MSSREAATALRSLELEGFARDVFPGSCHTAANENVVSRFGFFEEQRRQLVTGIDEAVLSSHLDADGRLTALVFDWSVYLFDGAAAAETDGYIDDDGFPPWDTWLDIVPPGSLDVETESGLVLLCWLPDCMTEAIDGALAVDASGAVARSTIEVL